MKTSFLPLLFVVLAALCNARGQAEPTPVPTPNDVPTPVAQPTERSATPAASRLEGQGRTDKTGIIDAKASEFPAKPEAVLTKLEQDWGDAIVRHDVGFLERTEADDYIYTGPDGIVTHKADEIAGAKAEFVRIDSFKHSDMNVQVYGDSAVVTGATTLKGKAGNVDLSGDFRWTDVFVKQDGQWRVVASQATSISTPQQED